MRLSTRSRYGARAMVELAKAYGGPPLMLQSIAERQEISKKYLEQIFVPLRAAGLVRAIRGPSGGYLLSRAPSEIRLGEILRVLEGSLALVECVEEPSLCGKADNCPTREVWGAVARAIDTILRSVTLADLMCEPAKLDEVLSSAGA